MKQRIRYLSLLVLLAIFATNFTHAQSLKRQSIGSLGSSDHKSGELYVHMTVGQTQQSQPLDKNIRIGYEQFLEVTKQLQNPAIQQLNLTAYPNPTAGQINFDLSEPMEAGVLNIFNVAGSLVYSEKLNQVQFISLSTVALDPGLYYSSILPNQGNISYTTKFIISK